jgi:DNA-binding FadR family transcriptional regulator
LSAEPEITARAYASKPSVRARAQAKAAEVRAAIERLMDEGRVRPGDKIATERELAAQFGASRGVVRAALAELRSVGRIVRRVGHGTVVQDARHPAAPTRPFALGDVSPSELLEFRLALEPRLAEAVVLNASENDLQAILETVERGDRAQGFEEWERSDRAFHASFVAATHNRLTIGVYDVVIGVRHERPWLGVKRGTSTASDWRGYQEQHRRIARALAARDAPAAEAAIREHLMGVRSKMLGG